MLEGAGASRLTGRTSQLTGGAGRLAGARPRPATGAVVSLVMVAAGTAAIYPLKRNAPTVTLSVVYLPAVLLVSTYWGLVFGLATSLLSAAAFNFFHLPPIGRFTIADSRNWVALGAFTIVAVAASTIAELARSRAAEAEARRGEADLAAALARALLAGSDTHHALGTTARLLATSLAMPSAAIELGTVSGDGRRRAIELKDAGGRQIATLQLAPDGLSIRGDLRGTGAGQGGGPNLQPSLDQPRESRK